MIRRLLGQRVGISGRWHLMSLTFIVALLLTAAFDPRVKDEPNTEQGNQELNVSQHTVTPVNWVD